MKNYQVSRGGCWVKENRVCNDFVVWLTGGILYFYLEIAFRGYSHYSMLVCGGLCFLLVGKVGQKIEKTCDVKWIRIIKIMLYGTMIITGLEFLTGLIVNKTFEMGVWDYSDMKYNVLGQICLQYSFLWAVLSLVCVYIYRKLYKYILL